MSRGLRDSARFPGKKKRGGGKESGSCRLLYVKQVGELIPPVTPIPIERRFPRGRGRPRRACCPQGPWAGGSGPRSLAGGRAATWGDNCCARVVSARVCVHLLERAPPPSAHQHPPPALCGLERMGHGHVSAESQAGYPSVVMEPIHVSICCCLFW